MSKCYACDRQPIRACLACGVFYCPEHGVFKETPKLLNQYQNLNSRCLDCAKAGTGQNKKLAMIFGILGGVEVILGTVILVSMQRFAPGGIFLLQGLIFGFFSLILGYKSMKDAENRRL
ncbi:MAG: hypothetical protein ACKO85_17385 [Isosphaeraceae bacterium]